MSAAINHSDYLIHSRDLSRIDALFFDIERQCKSQDNFEAKTAINEIAQHVQNFLNRRGENLAQNAISLVLHPFCNDK